MLGLVAMLARPLPQDADRGVPAPLDLGASLDASLEAQARHWWAFLDGLALEGPEGDGPPP